MKSTKEKAELCRALHAGAEPTLSAACWDVGTACLLAHVRVSLIDIGAMATRGLPDAIGLATREFMLGNARGMRPRIRPARSPFNACPR
jgi:hypothetical protein